MIAIDMPMPCSCSECIFRDGPYDCMLDNQIRVANILKPSECPLLEVKTMQVRHIGENNDVTRFYMGRCIGEALEKEHIVRFIARPIPQRHDPTFIQLRYINLVGEVDIVVPKEAR